MNARPKTMPRLDCENRLPSDRTQRGSSMPQVAKSSPSPTLATMLGIDDLASILNVSRRAVERLRSAGKIPKPDITLGRMPRWKPETIATWIDTAKGA